MLRAAAAALAAVVARHPAVERLREDRQPAGDARDLQLVGGLLDEQLVAARLGRRQEDAVGIVRQALVAAEDADERVDPVVVRLHVLVGDRPVVAETVEALAPEVVGTEAQRDAAPVVRAAAEHPRPEPVERGCPCRSCRARPRASSRRTPRRTRRTAASPSPRRAAASRTVHLNMYDSLDGFHIGPASSMTTLAPASVSTLAAMPPPAPEPTMQTS